MYSKKSDDLQDIVNKHKCPETTAKRKKPEKVIKQTPTKGSSPKHQNSISKNTIAKKLLVLGRNGM